MGPLWAYSDTLCARKGPKMGSILGHFRGPPNSEPPKSQIPDLRISGSRGPDLWIRLHHIVPMLLAGMSTPWCPYPHIHHGSKGHVWGCCGLYVYIYQQQKTPFWGLLKRHYGIQHNAIIPLAVVSGIPPGDIHHDGYHAGTIMAYGVRHMPHGMTAYGIMGICI